MNYLFYPEPSDLSIYAKLKTIDQIQQVIKEVGDMQKYKCTVCGYVYDPEIGDPDSGIKPGTPFENLPDNWVCPVCGAEKSLFEKAD